MCIGTYIRVIRKERKLQHQNPEFGHKQGENKKKPSKKYISIQEGGGVCKTQKTINFCGKLSFILLSFLWSPSSAASTYIFTAPTYTITIIIFKPCAFNAKFQHLILRFNKHPFHPLGLHHANHHVFAN